MLILKMINVESVCVVYIYFPIYNIGLPSVYPVLAHNNMCGGMLSCLMLSPCKHFVIERI